MKCLITLISITFLLTTPNIAQTKSPQATICYYKPVFLDSLTNKPLGTYIDLTKPLPILYVKDIYNCKCEIPEIEVSLIRGKRPLQTSYYGGPSIFFSFLHSSIAGFKPIAGDRVFVSVRTATSGNKNCHPLPGPKIVYVGVYK